MGLGLAFKLFWRGLTDDAFSRKVQPLLHGETAAAVITTPPPSPTAVPKPPARSEALTLLEVLQREGRLIDFLKEPIAGYADAQIGAAVRDIHRDCGAAIDRLFGIKPLRTESDGAMIEMPEHFDAAQYRLIGNVTGQQPYRGTLRHAGWQATCLQLPSWNGSSTAAHVIAPAEVEI
jgi:hypothetical protein